MAGLMNGLALALILGVAGSLIFGDWHLGWCWGWR
jgi:magnesium transporter